jgi:hypothetical protein
VALHQILQSAMLRQAEIAKRSTMSVQQDWPVLACVLAAVLPHWGALGAWENALTQVPALFLLAAGPKAPQEHP